MLEVRTLSNGESVHAGIRATNARTLEGYAAVFDKRSQDLGGFVEVIQPGAFSESLKRDPEDILALYDHDRRHILGRLGAGTLELREDDYGLGFTIQLPDTTVGRDLQVLVQRRDVAGASFAFTVPEGGDAWADDGETVKRTLKQVDLHEVTITSVPAYKETTVALRSMAQRCHRHPRLHELEEFLARC